MNKEQVVFIVDDDDGIREGLSILLESIELQSRSYSSALDFLEDFDPDVSGCLVLDMRMPRMSGLELQRKLCEMGSTLPIIFITGHGDVPMAVEAMRRGALDFIRKPFPEQDLLDRINEALKYDSQKSAQRHNRQELLDRIDSLSDRERQIFDRVAEGQMNKVIANDLGISERTVEVHRSQVMKKLKARSLATVVRAKLLSEMPDVELTAQV